MTADDAGQRRAQSLFFACILFSGAGTRIDARDPGVSVCAIDGGSGRDKLVEALLDGGAHTFHPEHVFDDRFHVEGLLPLHCLVCWLQVVWWFWW